jgi:hypothetical protein
LVKASAIFTATVAVSAYEVFDVTGHDDSLFGERHQRRHHPAQ